MSDTLKLDPEQLALLKADFTDALEKALLENARLRAELERVTKLRKEAAEEAQDNLDATLEARAWAVYLYGQMLDARKVAAQEADAAGTSDESAGWEHGDERLTYFRWCKECGGDCFVVGGKKARCERCGR